MAKNTLGSKIKSILGIEGDFKETVKPMMSYSCANISLAGAGYPKSLYYSQFLAFVEGLSTRQIGKISLVSGLVDAISDPVMGIITDHTRSKMGRHRPYLLFGSFFFAAAYIMIWNSFGISSSGNSTSVFTYYMIASVLYGLAYTVINIPHTAMLPQQAPEYFQRTQYNLVGYIFNSIGMVTAFIFSGLVLSGFNVYKAFFDMPDPSAELRSNYKWVGLFLGILFILPLLNCFRCTHEMSSENQMPIKRLNFSYVLGEYKKVFKNRAFRQYFFIYLFYMLSKNFYAITDQYFFISVADQYKIFLTIQTISGISEACGTPVNYLLIKNKGKPFCGKLLGPLMVLGLIMNSFITTSTDSSTAAAILLIGSVFYNFGFSGPGFVIDNIQPDVTDVDEMITGERREGTISTFRSLFTKTVSSLTSYFVNTSLGYFGYDTSKKEPKFQTAKSIFGLRLNFIFIPAFFAALCVITIYRYKMNKADHRLIQKLIEEKHEKGFVSVTDEEKKRLEKIAGQKWENMWIGQAEKTQEAAV